MPIPMESGRVEASGSLVYCTNCPTVGYASDRYCPACGSSMQRRCPSCGAPVAHLIARFCTQCGVELDGEEPPGWSRQS